MMTLRRPVVVSVAAAALTVLVGGVVPVAGVACTPPPPPPLPEGVLAIAYTNVTDDGDYDEADDVLIAKLVDTNEDGVPGAGDTIVTNQYPLSFDRVPQFGDFQITTHAVHHVEMDGPDGPGVYAYLSDSWSHWIAWRSESDVGESWTEIDPTPAPLFKQTTLTDDHLLFADQDVIDVDSRSPSRPNTQWFALSTPNHDHTWLEVDIAPGLL